MKCETGGKLYLKKTNGILDTTKDWCNDIDSNIASKNIDPIKNAFENHFNGEKLENPYMGILAFICQGTSAVQYKGCVVIGDTGWYTNKPPAQISIKTWFMNSQNNIDSIENTIPLR